MLDVLPDFFYLVLCYVIFISTISNKMTKLRFRPLWSTDQEMCVYLVERWDFCWVFTVNIVGPFRYTCFSTYVFQHISERLSTWKAEKWKAERRPKAHFMWAARSGSTIGCEMLSLKPRVSKAAGPISPCPARGHTRNAFCPRISQMSSWILITRLWALRPINLEEKIK